MALKKCFSSEESDIINEIESLGTKEIKSENKKEAGYDYYGEQLSSLLPVDEYGVSFQMRSSNGSSKWMEFNEESFEAIKEFMEKLKTNPDSVDAAIINEIESLGTKKR